MTLKEFLALKGVSATRFAAMLGWPPSTISRICDHGVVPNVQTAVWIEDFTEGVVSVRSFVPSAGPAPVVKPESLLPHNPAGLVEIELKKITDESEARADEARERRAQKKSQPKRKGRASGKG